MVGVDEDDTDFASAGLEGGEKTHRLNESEVGARTMASIQNNTGATKQVSGLAWGAINVANKGYVASCMYDLKNNGFVTQYNQPHNNLQPYKTVYIWERTE